MSLFSWFQKNPHGRPAEDEAEDKPLKVRSRGLESLLAGWPPSSGPRILDLGTASSAKLDFYRRFDARIRVESLWSTLSEALAVKHSRPPQLMTSSPGERYDLVFVWDLLNYMEPRLLRAFSPTLHSYCHGETLLFALVWTRPAMPSNPMQFNFLDGENMSIPPSGASQREAPLYTQTDLSRHLPDFRVDQSFLLKMGLQEYLLRPAQ
jgi:hypothetical protein